MTITTEKNHCTAVVVMVEILLNLCEIALLLRGTTFRVRITENKHNTSSNIWISSSIENAVLQIELFL